MTSWRKSRHIVLHHYHTVNLKAFIIMEIFRAICPYLSIIFVIMLLSVYMSWNGLILWHHTVTLWHEKMKEPFLHTPAYFAVLSLVSSLFLHMYCVLILLLYILSTLNVKVACECKKIVENVAWPFIGRSRVKVTLPIFFYLNLCIWKTHKSTFTSFS